MLRGWGVAMGIHKVVDLLASVRIRDGLDLALLLLQKKHHHKLLLLLIIVWSCSLRRRWNPTRSLLLTTARTSTSLLWVNTDTPSSSTIGSWNQTSKYVTFWIVSSILFHNAPLDTLIAHRLGVMMLPCAKEMMRIALWCVTSLLNWGRHTAAATLGLHVRGDSGCRGRRLELICVWFSWSFRPLKQLALLVWRIFRGTGWGMPYKVASGWSRY